MKASTKILVSLTTGLMAACAVWVWSLFEPRVAQWIGFSFFIMAGTMAALLFADEPQRGAR